MDSRNKDISCDPRHDRPLCFSWFSNKQKVIHQGSGGGMCCQTSAIDHNNFLDTPYS